VYAIIVSLSSVTSQVAFRFTTIMIFSNFRPLTLVGHLRTTGRLEMLHHGSDQRLFLLLSTSLVER
jgi:hypothetical protein